MPQKLRKNVSKPYEFREHEIEEVQFGNFNEMESDSSHKDYAFVKLKERVGQLVRRADGQGRESGHRQKVPQSRLIQPLPFKKFDREKIPNVGMYVGFQKDKKWEVQKNCEPFKFYQAPQGEGHNLSLSPGTILHDGDTTNRSSGSALTLLIDGQPHFTGVHVGSYSSGAINSEEDFDLYRRFNYGVDSNSFYEEFMAFRQKWGRR